MFRDQSEEEEAQFILLNVCVQFLETNIFINTFKDLENSITNSTIVLLNNSRTSIE